MVLKPQGRVGDFSPERSLVGFTPNTKVLNLTNAIILKDAIKLFIVFKHEEVAFT